MWSGGSGNRSDLKQKCIISSFLVFQNGFLLKLQWSSALRVLISDGQNHLVDVEDCFTATVSLLRTVEIGKKGFG